MPDNRDLKNMLIDIKLLLWRMQRDIDRLVGRVNDPEDEPQDAGK